MATPLLKEKSIAADKKEEAVVFKAGEQNYNKFRIPAVIKAPNGDILAFAEGREKGDHNNVDLVMKRNTKNGDPKEWKKQELKVIWPLKASDDTTFGNPCPVVDEEKGTIWLLFCDDGYDVWLTKSTDNGKNWATPSKISDQVKNPKWAWGPKPKKDEDERIIWTGPGIGIQIKQGKHKGRLVIPCHFQPFPKGKPAGVENNRMWVFYSDDHGKTWNYPPLSELGNESQVVELSNHDLMLNGRNQKGFGGKPIRRLTATSSNGGVKFTDSVRNSQLIDPVCQASILRYSFGRGHKNVILFSNPAHETKRERMTVRISNDDGKTWSDGKCICQDFSGYSCLVKQADDKIGLLYETKNSSLTYAKFSLEWLKK